MWVRVVATADPGALCHVTTAGTSDRLPFDQTWGPSLSLPVSFPTKITWPTPKTGRWPRTEPVEPHFLLHHLLFGSGLLSHAASICAGVRFIPKPLDPLVLTQLSDE